MAVYKMVNGQRVEMTQAEVDAFEAARTPSLDKAKASAYQQLRGQRMLCERAGASSGQRTIKADTDTITRLLAIAEAATPGQQVPVELVDSSVVMVPANALTGLITAARARMLAAMQVEAEKREEVAALATVAEVLAYDVTAGWPT